MKYKEIVNLVVFVGFFSRIIAEDPYRFFNWNITYGDISPLGVKQQVLLLSLSLSWHCINEIKMFLGCKCGDFLRVLAGDLDKWAISRAVDRICDER